MYEQANVPNNSKVWLKREVKFGVHPPGLTYGWGGTKFFNQSSKDLPTHPKTNPLGGDTDSMTTDVNTTQNQNKETHPQILQKRDQSKT